MKVKVRAFGDLTRLINNETVVELEDNTRLGDLISKLSERTGTTRKGYIGPYKVGSELIVLINGRNMDTLEPSFSLNNGDVVALLPPFVGG